MGEGVGEGGGVEPIELNVGVFASGTRAGCYNDRNVGGRERGGEWGGGLACGAGDENSHSRN